MSDSDNEQSKRRINTFLQNGVSAVADTFVPGASAMVEYIRQVIADSIEKRTLTFYQKIREGGLTEEEIQKSVEDPDYRNLWESILKGLIFDDENSKADVYAVAAITIVTKKVKRKHFEDYVRVIKELRRNDLLHLKNMVKITGDNNAMRELTEGNDQNVMRAQRLLSAGMLQPKDGTRSATPNEFAHVIVNSLKNVLV